ncbi:VPLPA-CTERM sorting domain-containing protein [Arenibacterium halophilum]|uniref:VPLPA-CTERM sorting domain-containing protein n=1 Tax=Arenibacterium halophilum TaxID=2583821 RepID=A0ABY2XDS7_9RHOB|nr:VPLPA-CTERM sorting domain-containing protein [Arenibacterium halophilum]TMV14851.1 VPLPA-CTERM sorting domain-containing protein [Arenibacterium halophilum]
MKLGLCVLAAGLFAASTASAATVYELTATSQVASIDNFSLTYQDNDNNQLFSLDELLSFSGPQRTLSGYSLTVLTRVKSIAGLTSSPDSIWIFQDSTLAAARAISDDQDYTYEVRNLSAQVPLPASGLLLLGGVGALVAARRNKRG